MLRVVNEAQRLIKIFDSKPCQTECYGKDCSKSATYCTVYKSNVYTPYWWCEDCDPYEQGADEGKLQVVGTYQDAINHCSMYCTTRDAIKDLIKTLAQAKGLPNRVGEAQAERFFAP